MPMSFRNVLRKVLPDMPGVKFQHGQTQAAWKRVFRRRPMGLKCLSLTLLVGFIPGLAHAAYIAQFSIDMSLSQVASGYIGFQLNPSDPSSPPATAAITNFVSGLNGAPTVTGNVSGSLSGTLLLANTTAFNSYLQQVTFANPIGFRLQLSASALGLPNGSATSGFAVSLFDSALNPILTSDPFGIVFRADVDNAGNVTTTTFRQRSGAPSPVSVQAASSVPEPVSYSLVLLALALGVAYSFIRRTGKDRMGANLSLAPEVR